MSTERRIPVAERSPIQFKSFPKGFGGLKNDGLYVLHCSKFALICPENNCFLYHFDSVKTRPTCLCSLGRQPIHFLKVLENTNGFL